jgi:hypothetical protein
VNCDYLVASKKFRVICKDGIAETCGSCGHLLKAARLPQRAINGVAPRDSENWSNNFRATFFAQLENKRKLENKKNWPFDTSLAYTSVQAKGSVTPRAPQTLASIPV